MKTANSKWLALRYNYTLRLHRLLLCYSLLPRCWRAEWGARTGSFSVLLCRWIHMAIHNRLFQKSYYYVKWARGSTYSQYKGHQVGAQVWCNKRDMQGERIIFLFSALACLARCAANCRSGQSTKGTLSTCHIYDRDLCWCAFEQNRHHLFSFTYSLFSIYLLFIVMLTIVSTRPTSENRTVFTRHYITGVLFRQIEVTFDLS